MNPPHRAPILPPAPAAPFDSRLSLAIDIAVVYIELAGNDPEIRAIWRGRLDALEDIVFAVAS